MQVDLVVLSWVFIEYNPTVRFADSPLDTKEAKKRMRFPRLASKPLNDNTTWSTLLFANAKCTQCNDKTTLRFTAMTG